MGRAPHNRSGKVSCQLAAERWIAQVRLYETIRAETRRHDITLLRTFPSEAAAARAGEQVLAEWIGAQASLRDLVLRQLAATYRAYRETYKAMHPPTVPATRSAWDGAIDAWVERGWMDSADATRCREQIDRAFATEAAPVRRHRLQPDPDRDPAR
jgi:hypothetical protein